MVGRSNFEYIKIDTIAMTSTFIQEWRKYRYQDLSPTDPFPSDSFRIPLKPHMVILSIWFGSLKYTVIVSVVSSEHRITFRTTSYEAIHFSSVS